ncbi:hypothetical protein Ccrd_018447 [Cynara cardunculus var. scolymus]|uniref:Uncharacterized protein n=1 Tax=Cynara cardunculus var. scolymus TaxID=59895 RepID=A0A124SFH5_CYNCS|nr:hypothetical protein Ccrd_018447 [Cynara cardunculus var. scolymus]
MAANLAQMGGSQEVFIAAYNQALEVLISSQLLRSPSNFSEVLEYNPSLPSIFLQPSIRLPDHELMLLLWND